MKEPGICKIIVEEIDNKFKFGADKYSIYDILTDDAIIFGGIIRDIVADDDCKNSKDMDIIVSKTGSEKIIKYLNDFGYKNSSFKYASELASKYDDNAFHLYVYEDEKFNRIDLIIPIVKDFNNVEITCEMSIDELYANIMHLLTVDLSSSLIGYNKCFGLLYNNNKELGLIKRKIFKYNKGLKNDNPRFKLEKAEKRAEKLIQKDWILIQGEVYNGNI